MKGLVLAVKAYERAAIRVVISRSILLAHRAMLLYPPSEKWEPTYGLLNDMIEHNPSLQYFRALLP